MPKRLTEAQVEQYKASGYLFPLAAFGAPEVARFREGLDAVERREGGKLSMRTNQKPHLLLPWLNDLMRAAPILDAVEDVIGPNILAWATGFFYKRPHDGK